MRWDPPVLPDAATPIDFIDGLYTIAGNGDCLTQTGIGIHLYAANRSMTDRFFYDADGELLIVPQQGRLHLHTELGVLAPEGVTDAVVAVGAPGSTAPVSVTAPSPSPLRVNPWSICRLKRFCT